MIICSIFLFNEDDMFCPSLTSVLFYKHPNEQYHLEEIKWDKDLLMFSITSDLTLRVFLIPYSVLEWIGVGRLQKDDSSPLLSSLLFKCSLFFSPSIPSLIFYSFLSLPFPSLSIPNLILPSTNTTTNIHKKQESVSKCKPKTSEKVQKHLKTILLKTMENYGLRH